LIYNIKKKDDPESFQNSGISIDRMSLHHREVKDKVVKKGEKLVTPSGQVNPNVAERLVRKHNVG